MSGTPDTLNPTIGTEEPLGAFIRRHRERLGLTQTELGEAAGIKQSYVSGLERGINLKPDPKYLLNLARVFGVTDREILTKAGLPTGEPVGNENDRDYVSLTVEGETVTISIPRNLSAEARRGIDAMINAGKVLVKASNNPN